MLEKLRQLGWGEYEAKVYIALLRQNPATGYRIAKEAGVPTAKVYEALARLVERGAIRQASPMESEPVQYAPVPPEEVMAGLRARHARMLDELTRELTACAAPAADSGETHRLRGRAPVLGRANALLASAQVSIALAVPQGWESALRSGLDAARSRQVRVDRVTLAPEPHASAGPGLLALVADGSEALLGALGASADDAAAEAIATRAPFLARLCADYIRLRRAVALTPEAVARLQRHDDWLGWEEAKQRRLLQSPSEPAARSDSRIH